MDENILKTCVYTNKTVFCETVEQPLDADFSLPDYYPDIRKVLKCKAVPRITSKNVSGKTVTLDGVVTVTVFYCDEDGKINAFEYSHSFEKSKETGDNLEDCRITLKPKCEYVNCRAITNRKIDIHGAISIKITAKKKTGCEIVSDIDDKTIEILRNCAPATTPTGSAEKYILIEEECDLNTENGADLILRYDAQTVIKECKTVSGKIIVKGEMLFNLRYSEDNQVKIMKTQLPFSQIMEIETVGENCECDAKVQICFLDAKPRTDSNGKFLSVSLNAKLLLLAETYCKNDIALIEDAYSKKYKTDIIKENIAVSRIVKKINENFSLKKSVDTDNLKIASIIDNWGEVKVTETKTKNDAFIICGNVTASFIAEEESGESCFFEKVFDFEYKYPLPEKNDDMRLEADVYISSCGYTILSENSLEVMVELNVSAVIFENKNISAVTAVNTTNENNPEKNSENAMVIYFASKGERLWNIARKYYASMQDIKTVNGITDEILPENVTLLIPIE